MNLLRSLVLLGFLAMPLIALGCASGPQSATVGEHIDDSIITTKVQAALLGDSEVDGLDIQVKTFQGQVQLSGFVNKNSQNKRAKQLAHEVEGVRSVRNNLIVKSRQSRDSNVFRSQEGSSSE